MAIPKELEHYFTKMPAPPAAASPPFLPHYRTEVDSSGYTNTAWLLLRHAVKADEPDAWFYFGEYLYRGRTPLTDSHDDHARIALTQFLTQATASTSSQQLALAHYYVGSCWLRLTNLTGHLSKARDYLSVANDAGVIQAPYKLSACALIETNSLNPDIEKERVTELTVLANRYAYRCCVLALKVKLRDPEAKLNTSEQAAVNACLAQLTSSEFLQHVTDCCLAIREKLTALEPTEYAANAYGKPSQITAHDFFHGTREQMHLYYAAVLYALSPFPLPDELQKHQHEWLDKNPFLDLLMRMPFVFIQCLCLDPLIRRLPFFADWLTLPARSPLTPAIVRQTIETLRQLHDADTEARRATAQKLALSIPDLSATPSMPTILVLTLLASYFSDLSIDDGVHVQAAWRAFHRIPGMVSSIIIPFADGEAEELDAAYQLVTDIDSYAAGRCLAIARFLLTRGADYPYFAEPSDSVSAPLVTEVLTYLFDHRSRLSNRELLTLGTLHAVNDKPLLAFNCYQMASLQDPRLNAEVTPLSVRCGMQHLLVKLKAEEQADSHVIAYLGEHLSRLDLCDVVTYIRALLQHIPTEPWLLMPSVLLLQQKGSLRYLLNQIPGFMTEFTVILRRIKTDLFEGRSKHLARTSRELANGHVPATFHLAGTQPWPDTLLQIHELTRALGKEISASQAAGFDLAIADLELLALVIRFHHKEPEVSKARACYFQRCEELYTACSSYSFSEGGTKPVFFASYGDSTTHVKSTSSAALQTAILGYVLEIELYKSDEGYLAALTDYLAKSPPTSQSFREEARSALTKMTVVPNPHHRPPILEKQGSAAATFE